MYETVCAFLNRHGGTILLGVQDSGEISGIDPGAANQLKKDFVTTINNPQKLHPPAYLSVDEVVLDGETLLHIYVPESSQVHRCNGRIVDRNEDGDLDLIDNTVHVAQLCHRKQARYSENRAFPHLGLDDIDRELLAKCRKIAVLHWDDHPWKDLDDLELLKSAQLYQTNSESGVSGIALSGILLLAPVDSAVIPLPHQIRALRRAISLDKVGFLLADELGLGKTIEAGLIMRELKLRGLVTRTLVVSPRGLVTQWVAEMQTHLVEEFRLFEPSDFGAFRRMVRADNVFDSLYVEALLRPERLDTEVGKAVEHVREETRSAHEQTPLFDDPVTLDPEEARRAAGLPLSDWVEAMVVDYLEANDGKIRQRGGDDQFTAPPALFPFELQSAAISQLRIHPRLHLMRHSVDADLVGVK